MVESDEGHSKLVSNFEIFDDKVNLYVNPKIFPLELIKESAKEFKSKAWVTIDGDTTDEIVVEIVPKQKTDLEPLAREFNNNLLKISTSDSKVDEENQALVNKIRNVVREFIIDERGSMTKKSSMVIGTLLAGIGLAAVAEEVFANHLCDDGSGGGDGGGGNGGGCCFPAGTKITMADSTFKNIEDVEVNDKVLGFDESKQEFGAGKVSGLLEVEKTGIYILNGGILRLTEDHPIYTKKSNGEKVWTSINPMVTRKSYNIPIQKMEIGDEILKVNLNCNTDNGLVTMTKQWVKLFSIEFLKGRINTYHLIDVEGCKTFVADNIVAHNSDGGGCTDPGPGTDSGGGDSADGDDK